MSFAKKASDHCSEIVGDERSKNVGERELKHTN